ncbi:hypothetical protein E4665_15775 [Sporolactobacillus shoreae]|uniref:SH3b domain-containing protein n=1 Tax=Sporolactobacillus shoreae TaxID=1465501 RepID=A0A4Z0GI62_9BACL|nr:GH25 family lysozyme [Sporolactobacillus shoreae]TGA96413.1 hypothetical protein E4665_15775 [Sporolactobacillus shoreae]
MAKLFIDLNHSRGVRSVSEFQQMKKDGILAVTIKLSEGHTFKDPMAASYIKNATAAGLLVNAYHFFRANSPEEAKAEAEFFLSLAKFYGVPKNARIPLDIEVVLGGNMTENALVFINTVKAAGYLNVTWYSNQPFTDAHLDESKLPANPWKAGYPAKVDLNKPPFKNVGAWQYTDKVKLKGISGTFDCSVDYTGAFTSRPQAKKAVKQASKPMTLVQYLDAKKQDSSFNARAKLAKQYGIKAYIGTAGQNTQLLSYLQAGKKPELVKAAPKPTVEKTVSYIVAASLLNIRKAPNGQVVGTLKQGQQVEVERISNGWAQIKSGTGHVYVGAQYLKKK